MHGNAAPSVRYSKYSIFIVRPHNKTLIGAVALKRNLVWTVLWTNRIWVEWIRFVEAPRSTFSQSLNLQCLEVEKRTLLDERLFSLNVRGWNVYWNLHVAQLFGFRELQSYVAVIPEQESEWSSSNKSCLSLLKLQFCFLVSSVFSSIHKLQGKGLFKICGNLQSSLLNYHKLWTFG